MDSFKKKRIVSKISNIHNQLKDLSKVPNYSKAQRALIGDLKRKKRRLHGRINKGIQHPYVHKVMWFYKKYLKWEKLVI